MPTGLGDEQLWLSATNDNTGTSTAFQDQSGNGNNGTAVGTLVVADTSEGGSYAFDLDGTNDYISTSFGPSSWLTTGVFSLSAWVKYDTLQSSGIVGGDLSSSRSGISNVFDAAQAGLGHGIAYSKSTGGSYGALAYAGDRDSVATSQWYHVLSTGDGTNVKVYVNGVLAGTTAIAGFSAVGWTSNLEVGCCRLNSARIWFLDGRTDDIRAYNRTLTQAEITHLASQRGIEGPPPVGLGDEQLWLCPSLNDSANDISGNGNNGTYNGGMGTVADTSNGGSLAYQFDGVDDYIDCGDILDTQVWTAGDFAISGWIKTNGSNTVQVFNKYYSLSGQRQFHFRVLYTGGNLRLNAYIHTTLNNSEYRFWLGSTNLTANTWYHVSLNYDASAASNDRALCFINGSSETMTVTDSSGTLSTIKDGSASLAVGARVDGASASDFRTGRSDDLRVYNRTLTQAEITHLATSRGIEGSPGAATHYNPFKTHAFTNNFQQRLR